MKRDKIEFHTIGLKETENVTPASVGAAGFKMLEIKDSTDHDDDVVEVSSKSPTTVQIDVGSLDPDECFLLGRAESGRHVQSNAVNEIHRVRITEVAPCHCFIMDGRSKKPQETEEWKMDLSDFTSKKQSSLDKNWAKRIRSYYKQQDQLIDAFEELRDGLTEESSDEKENKLTRRAELLGKISLAANVLLLLAKLVAAILSGSISIISSLVDSVVDLASGIIIWITAKTVRKRKPYQYPQGRTKLEPIAIVILSVIMAVASLQLIRESIEKIIGLAQMESSPPNVDIATIVITISTIVIKIVLYLLCRRGPSASVLALALDHRNDVVSNSAALVFGYLGSKDLLQRTGEYGLVYIDPIGAIVISLYIIVNWWITGKEQIKLLTGFTAKPDFLKKITWLSVNHHPDIKYVETVRAFHFGNNFLVEVDIVLPEDMTLKDAHNIGEPLQQKLERLPEVERAFVHVDYNVDHLPEDEHKIV